MNQLESLLRLFSSTDTHFLMRKSDYISELAALVPFIMGKKELIENKSYPERMSEVFSKLKVNSAIKLTERYNAEEEENSLAYYRIHGTITADSYWRFSSKEFEHQLLLADANPAITGHFVHITSGGGEAWYLDQLASTIRSLTKPKFAFIEKLAASAGYYIASQFDKVSTSTPFDLIGCIGTMVSMMDMQPAFEKFGVKFIEEYATNSDLKNKKYNDLLDGKPEQFIREDLDPLQAQFVQDVKLTRAKIALLPEDHAVLRGETYYGSKALELGMIDSIESFENAVVHAYNQSVAWKADQQTQRKRALASLK